MNLSTHNIIIYSMKKGYTILDLLKITVLLLMFSKIYFKWALDDGRANLIVQIGDFQDRIWQARNYNTCDNLNPPVIKAAGEAAFALSFVLVFITVLIFCFHIYFAKNAGTCLHIQACLHFIST